MTTRINPRQIEVGPLPEDEPPPMMAGGMVFRNGRLVGGDVVTVATGGAQADAVTVEQFIVQRRQQEEDILDAGARGDPALLFALLRWALRHTDAPSNADLAEWMEEGRERLSPVGLPAAAAQDPPRSPKRKREAESDGADERA